ncbi:hypothetical protein ACX1C1_16400 [Paenibacillus sp. strain BS8-2]
MKSNLIVMIAGLAWLILSIRGFHQKQEDKWARSMFIFSLNHITVLLLAIVGYSIGAPLLS